MQFLGIGLPELLLILILTVIVVGPERLPEVAAQMARFIRQAQSYANYVRKDFNDVIGELEKEVGANREDLKTIAEAFRRDTASVFEEIDKAGKEAQEATDLQKLAGGTTVNGASQNGAQDAAALDSTALKEAAMAEGEAETASEVSASGSLGADPANPEDWFKPTPSRRRRRSGESG